MSKPERSPAVCSQPRRTTKLAKWAFVFTLTSTALLWYVGRGQKGKCSPLGCSSLKSEKFNWGLINPSDQLLYTTCFGVWQCARLKVPMDWNSTSLGGSQVTIAVIKIPAPVSVTDPRYGGAILLNPGGPGGSGVDFIFSDGTNLTKIVNPLSSLDMLSSGRYFDLISFDPRGVNNTTPHLPCFSDSLSYDVWRHQEEADGIDHTSDVSLSLAWARAKAVMETCAQDNEISKHMNTVPVARDMVEIIERHGEWRGNQAELWLASKGGRSTTDGKEIGDPYSRDAVIERTKWRKGDEKLQYWGFSYGTILGQTFAAMYPHRVGRMVLDGVGDSSDYYNTAWMRGLNDTDKIMSRFFEYCSVVGKEKCALNIDNSTSSEIWASLESLISSLHQDPIAVAGNGTQGPEIITYSDVMMMIRKLIYRPLDFFPEMADLLADVVHGNGSTFAAYKQRAHKPTCPFSESNGDHDSCQPYSGGLEVTKAILCSDGRDITNTTKEDFKGIGKALYQQSRWMGEFWSTVTLPCVHWRVRPDWGITADEIKGVTSHPILWIGNTLDPVTPLANAHAMSKRFPGSVVLEQNSEGHVCISSPSACTYGHVRKYFQTGDLPAAGTVCQPDQLPFGHVTLTGDDLSREDEIPSVELRNENGLWAGR